MISLVQSCTVNFLSAELSFSASFLRASYSFATGSLIRRSVWILASCLSSASIISVGLERSGSAVLLAQ